MNVKNRDETMISKIKEKRNGKLGIKYKKLLDIKIPMEKNSISEFFSKTSFINKENSLTPIIKSNQINSIFGNIKTNNINILDKNKFNSSFGLKKKVNKISPNLFFIKLKENKYFSPINRNKIQGIFYSPSFSNNPQTKREKNLLDISNSRMSEQFHNISYRKYLNDSKSQNNFINVNYYDKSNSQKRFKIQKFLLNRNNSQKILFNNSFQNFNNSSKNIISNNNSISLSSIPIKEFNSKISDKEDNNTLNKFKKMHEIDLRINELLKKNNKDNEIKEKDKKINKQIYLQQIAQFYDNLPSLIMKKNIDKNLIKPKKKEKSKNFDQNFYSPLQILRGEENQKDESDKFIQNNPMIKYIFLQKVLNSLVHRVKLFGQNKDNLVINSNTITKLNEKIQDFITYGYEFIPEDFLRNKNLESPKDLIKDEEFINIIIKTKSGIENTLNKNDKEFSKINAELDVYTEPGIKIISKNLKQSSNLMNRFLELQNKKNKMLKKSRFLFKKIENNGGGKILLNKSTNYDYSKINSKNNSFSNDKSDNAYKKSKIINNINNEGNILTQLFHILYEDINNLEDDINKDKINNEERNIIKHKEKFWQRLLQKNDNNELIYYIKKKKRKIKSGEKRNKKIKNVLNTYYGIEPIENRKIKSGKKYIELQIDSDSEGDKETKAIKNIKPKRDNYSPDNKYCKNNLKKEEKNNKKINLNKKTEKVIQILKKIPETINIFDSSKENKKKEKNINKNYYFKRKKLHLKSLKRYNKSEEKEENSRNKNDENSKENKNDILKDKKKDGSYYTNLLSENILNKNKEEQKKEEENKIIIEEEKKNKENKFRKHNEKILLKMIDSEKRNKKKKIKIKDGLKVEENKEKKEADNKNENTDIKPKKETQIFFKNMKGKSLKEIEKKKIELLYKLKYDIKYKISTGEINPNQLENFEEFQEKLDKLKNRYEEYDINSYIKEMEKYFQSFRDEIENNGKKKIEEERINKYLSQFHADYYFKQFYKNLQENILCKVINYSQINHINTLNDSKDKIN